MLRHIQESDQAAILAIATSPKVNPTYMLPDFAKTEDAIPLFQRLMALSREENRFVRAIEANGVCVGFLNDVEQKDGAIELGYALHPDHWGNGYATAALKEAIGQLFARGFRQVVCGAFRTNAASIRVMEKAGMQRIPLEETIEYRGQAHRCIYLSITLETL